MHRWIFIPTPTGRMIGKLAAFTAGDEHDSRV
jgi:hypothetical protein